MDLIAYVFGFWQGTDCLDLKAEAIGGILEERRAALKIIKKEEPQGIPCTQPLDKLGNIHRLTFSHPVSSKDKKTMRRNERGYRGGSTQEKVFTEHFCSLASRPASLSVDDGSGGRSTPAGGLGGCSSMQVYTRRHRGHGGGHRHDRELDVLVE